MPFEKKNEMGLSNKQIRKNRICSTIAKKRRYEYVPSHRTFFLPCRSIYYYNWYILVLEKWESNSLSLITRKRKVILMITISTLPFSHKTKKVLSCTLVLLLIRSKLFWLFYTVPNTSFLSFLEYGRCYRITDLEVLLILLISFPPTVRPVCLCSVWWKQRRTICYLWLAVFCSTLWKNRTRWKHARWLRYRTLLLPPFLASLLNTNPGYRYMTTYRGSCSVAAFT